MGKLNVEPWLNFNEPITEEFSELSNLIKLDVSVVYPDYYVNSFNFPVLIPPKKVERVRRNVRTKKVNELLENQKLTQFIIDRKETYYLEPVKVQITPPRKVYNPVTKTFVTGSDYLFEVFQQDYFAYWFSSLITFYRHNHIRSYDLSWKNEHYAKNNDDLKKLKSHDDFRSMVNNKAKCQLVYQIMNDNNITKFGKIKLIHAVLNLEHNDDKTMELVNKSLRHLGIHR